MILEKEISTHSSKRGDNVWQQEPEVAFVELCYYNNLGTHGKINVV